VRNETSQSKKDDKESYQEEIVISGVPPPIESDIFFLTRGGEFWYRSSLYNSFGIFFITDKRVGFDEERRRRVMKRVIGIFLALAILTVFSLGCTGVAKDTKIKCPKCGAVFTVDEGLAEFQKKGY
jgi:hypothetical protein